MQKWEYLVLSFRQTWLNQWWISDVMINYQYVEPLKQGGIFSKNKYPEWATDIRLCLSRLGDEGWELLSIPTDPERNALGMREFIFKRPKLA